MVVLNKDSIVVNVFVIVGIYLWFYVIVLIKWVVLKGVYEIINKIMIVVIVWKFLNL